MAVTSVTYAQPAPLPDFSVPELLLQQQRERELRDQMDTTPNERLQGMEGVQAPAPPELLIRPEEVCFQIDKVVLTGEMSAQFQWALSRINHSLDGTSDPALGRCLGTGGINVVMGRLQNAIIKKGFITTRIVAAPQDLTTGTLTLTVIPGRIRAIRFAKGSDTRTSWRSALPMREGDLLNLRDLEQGLEVLKRVPTQEADIQIEPGQETGESDLVLAVKQKFPFRLNMSVDDGGSLSTGRYQGALTVSYDNWFTLNDLFYVSINHALGDGQGGGSNGYSMHYSIPFKGDWLLSLNGSSYKYDQDIAGINQNYTYSGDSKNLDISLSRRLYRDESKRLNVYGKGWARRSHNFIDDMEILVQRRRTAGWEVGADYRHYVGNAILNASFSYKRGTGAGKALRAPEEAFNEGTSRMEVYNLNATLSLPWQIGTQRFRYFGTLRAQWNGTSLVSQDQFAIGGRYTVRGFDGRTNLMGDRGWLIRNDVGWVIGNTGQEFYAGLDHGKVSGPATRYQVGQNLTGAVIGLRGGYNVGPGSFSYEVFTGTWLHKPDGFKASRYTAGFNINMSF